jgi:hypothetical protein
MTRILATGQFRAYQRSTDIATYKEDMRKFSEEGAAFRAHQQVVFQSDVAYLVQADGEIKEFEKNVSAKSGKLNTTQAYKKLQEVQRSRLGMMKARRVLLQQVSLYLHRVISDMYFLGMFFPGSCLSADTDGLHTCIVDPSLLRVGRVSVATRGLVYLSWVETS